MISWLARWIHCMDNDVWKHQNNVWTVWNREVFFMLQTRTLSLKMKGNLLCSLFVLEITEWRWSLIACVAPRVGHELVSAAVNILSTAIIYILPSIRSSPMNPRTHDRDLKGRIWEPWVLAFCLFTYGGCLLRTERCVNNFQFYWKTKMIQNILCQKTYQNDYIMNNALS